MSNRDTQEPSESETQGLVPNLPEESDGETINIAGTEISVDAPPQPAQDKYKGFPQVKILCSERKHRTRSATQSLPPSTSNTFVAARIKNNLSKERLIRVWFILFFIRAATAALDDDGGNDWVADLVRCLRSLYGIATCGKPLYLSSAG